MSLLPRKNRRFLLKIRMDADFQQLTFPPFLWYFSVSMQTAISGKTTPISQVDRDSLSLSLSLSL
jgi:hypothetical protein